MNTFVTILVLAGMAMAKPQWQGHGGHGSEPSQWNHWGNDNIPKWNGPLALPPGYDKNGAPLPVQDTPEVAAQKAAQLNVLAGAGGNVPAPNWNAPAHGGWNNGNNGGWNNGNNGAWNNGNNGAWNNGNNGGWNNGNNGGWSNGGWNNGNQGAWNGGHQGGWAGTQNGLPADTPEVAAAKAAHLAAHASAGHGAHGRWRRSALLAPIALAHYPVVRTHVLNPWGYHTLSYASHWW